MGMFMSSVAFRCNDAKQWEVIKPKILKMVEAVDGLVNNFDASETGFCVLSPYGDGGSFLAELPEKISALSGGYAVFATCVDSDFDIIELYCNGELLENSFIGHVYEEYADFYDVKAPDINLWKPLLLDDTKVEELHNALFSEEVFAEDHLRLLSELTGLPIFDDEMMQEAEV